MARIGKVSSHVPAWQTFDPTKAKLTRKQKEAIKRKELQQLCRDAIKDEKMRFAFYQVNSNPLPLENTRSYPTPPTVKALSRYV